MVEGEMLKTLLRLISRKSEDPQLEDAGQVPPRARPAERGGPRPLHYAFAHKVLPAVFFNIPENFLFVLRFHGARALLASWERVGSDLETSDRLPGTGLDCELRQLGDQMTIALITLPAPQQSPEAYFVAAVYRAARGGESALVRFFTLERREPGPNLDPFVCEWTPQETHHIRSAIAKAQLEPFFRCVYDIVTMPSA